MRIDEDRIHGAVLGLAIGDALGYPNEFLSHEEIMNRTQHDKETTPFLVTDDTQMSLYVLKAYKDAIDTFGHALVNIDKDESIQTLFAMSVANQFVTFYDDPDNDRAPGMTCMNAINDYMHSAKETGLEGMVVDRKGCGANMRCGWLGLLPYQDEDLAVMATVQAKTTHGHPDALLSSILTTHLVHYLAKNKVHPSTEGALIRQAIHILDHQDFYDGEKRLDPSNLRKMFSEALIVLPEYVYSNPSEDICSIFNMSGATADEALILAVAACDAQSDSDYALEGIQRLANSMGDSDSIAAIGGALIGAHRGAQQLREDMEEYMSFEPRYQEELQWAMDFITTINENWKA